jgi:co-chaperonin GroES (HSP10)
MKLSGIKPQNDMVLIRLDNGEVVSPGGIVIDGHGGMIERPDMSTGTVLAVGPGKRHPRTGERIPCDARVGNRVHIPTKFCMLDLSSRTDAPDADEILLVRDEHCSLAEET